MKPVRLLVVLTSPVRGGVEEVALSLLCGLGAHGFQLGVAAPTELLDQIHGELPRDVECFSVAADSWLRVGEVERLALAFRRFQPDVVNPHLFRSALVAAPLAKWCGVPAVVETYHGRE